MRLAARPLLEVMDVQVVNFAPSAERHPTNGEIALVLVFAFVTKLAQRVGFRPGRLKLLLIPALLALAVSQSCCRAGELQVALAAVFTPVATNAVVGNTHEYSLSFTRHPTSFDLDEAPAAVGKPARQSFPGLVLVPPQARMGFFESLLSGQPGNGYFGILNFQVGYGQGFSPDSDIVRGRNGTGLEEPSYVFLKRIVRF